MDSKENCFEDYQIISFKDKSGASVEKNLCTGTVTIKNRYGEEISALEYKRLYGKDPIVEIESVVLDIKRLKEEEKEEKARLKSESEARKKRLTQQAELKKKNRLKKPKSTSSIFGGDNIFKDFDLGIDIDGMFDGAQLLFDKAQVDYETASRSFDNFSNRVDYLSKTYPKYVISLVYVIPEIKKDGKVIMKERHFKVTYK